MTQPKLKFATNFDLDLSQAMSVSSMFEYYEVIIHQL